MPLRAHLREFRSRLIKSVLAIVVGAAAGWFAYDPLYAQLTAPLTKVAQETNRSVSINFSDLTGAFNMHVSLSIYLGLILASPVWFYQIWAFVVPGLTKRERGYGISFVAAALPLFLAGVAMAWFTLPNAARFLIGFAPAKSTSFLTAADYLDFVTRLMLAFGVAFVLPVFLVALNAVGVMPARALVKGWRVATFLCFLFAAVASPTPDANSMIFLATPMVALYFIAVGVAQLNDRRRARRRAQDGLSGLSDDEGSSLHEAGAMDSVSGENTGDEVPAESLEKPSAVEASGQI